MNVNDSAAGGVGQIETIVTGLGDRPTGIHVVDASRQISGKNDLSHSLCFPSLFL